MVEGKAAAVIGTGVTLGNIVMTVVVLLVTSASEDVSVLMVIPGITISTLTSSEALVTNRESLRLLSTDRLFGNLYQNAHYQGLSYCTPRTERLF